MAFEIDERLEGFLELERDNPTAFAKLRRKERDDAHEYATIKAEQSLPESQRPKRRRFMSSKDKADYITKHSSGDYLSLPW